MSGTRSGKTLSKDQVILAQTQTIEKLRAQIQRLSQDGASTSALENNSVGHVLQPGVPVNIVDVPTLSFEELSAYPDIQPLQFVDGRMIIQPATTSSPTRGIRGGRGRRGRGCRAQLRSPSKRRNQGASDVVNEMDDALMNIPGQDDANEGDAESAKDNEDGTSSQNVGGEMTHVLILGTPHTRKIPLKCCVPDCEHGGYKAWDRDLLLKHFRRYHSDTHPNPAFNYICPVEGCRFITYNEPSYALYTHIKNIHPDYLRLIEQSIADGVPVEERDMSNFHIDKLPSQTERTAVAILGVLNMEKTGMRCPLPVCEGGTQVFKSSSIKRLNEHFARVHGATHPNPLFVFNCPVTDCNYVSDVGNFRVYYHLKSEHPEYVKEHGGASRQRKKKRKNATVQNGDGVGAEGDDQTEQVNADAEQEMEESEANVSTQDGEEGEVFPPIEDESDGIARTPIIMRGSRNMVLDPLECTVEDCTKDGFFATSTATLRRHYQRYHRDSHPNPQFFFQCPSEGCPFISTNKPGMNIWRHTKTVHPELWAQPMTESSTAAMDIQGESVIGNSDDALFERPWEEQLRVEAVQDVLDPYKLVKPAQVRCLHPFCVKPPFSGSDKVQMMRHYAHFHPHVDRLQKIILVCPFKDCGFQATWPAKQLYYHFETVHIKPAEDTSRSQHLLSSKSSKEKKSPAVGMDVRTPVKIVGRPTAAGEFWCPLAGCGYSNNVLLSLRLHVIEKHPTDYPNPAFIYMCPQPGCGFGKQNNYQALCTHMQREHGLKREKLLPKTEKSRTRSPRNSSLKRRLEEEISEDGVSPEEEQAALTLEAMAADRAVEMPEPNRKKQKIKASGVKQKPVAAKRRGRKSAQDDSDEEPGPSISSRRGSARKAKSSKKH